MNDDLDRTFIHEASHVVIGRALGAQGDLFVWRESTLHPWRGRACIEVAEASHRILVALAGSIAEDVLDAQGCVREHRPTPAALYADADAQRSDAAVMYLSDADLLLAEGFTTDHFASAMDLVILHAPKIASLARTAIEAAAKSASALGFPPP